MKNMTLSKALMLLFIAEIVSIFSGIAIVGVVACVLNLLALYGASQYDQGYKTAFVLSIADIVIAVLIALVSSDGFIGTLIGTVSTVVNLGILYYVVMTTVKHLEAAGNFEVSAKGVTVWKINLICNIVAVVMSLLVYIPFLINIIAAVVGVVVAIVSLVGAILYLIFLYKSSKAL